MAYYKLVTYILWVTLGWMGAHHFYLKRDRHAFVWFWTAGGGLLIGWITDIFFLPRYVNEANMEEKYASGQLPFPKDEQRSAKRPSSSKRRYLGEFVFGVTLGMLLMAAVPEELGDDVYHFLSSIVGPAGVALGVHTVANIGAEMCDLLPCFLASYIVLPILLLTRSEHHLNILTKGIIFTIVAVNYNFKTDDQDEDEDRQTWLLRLKKAWAVRTKRYRRSKRVKRRLCTRLAVLGGCSAVLCLCAMSSLYFNTYVKTDYGEEILLRVAVENFFKSPIWISFRETFWIVLNRAWEGGAENFFRELTLALDPEGEQNAYKVLGLNMSATEKEINEHYKALVKKSHPDKFPNASPDQKKEISERFIEIQKAYERISKIKSKRIKKNIKMEL